MTLGQASIDTDDVAAHLADSTFTGDEFGRKLDAVRTLERRVVAASATGPAAIGDALLDLVDLWREHDGRLQTILDALATGPTGVVTITTDELRQRVAAINGPVNGGSYEIRDDGLDIIVDGQFGNDTIDVTQNADGTTTVVINGDTIELDEDESDDLRIEGGGGHDTITVNPYHQRVVMTPGGPFVVGADEWGVRIDGGAGNDIITGGTGADQIDGGAGRDYIDAGAGDDKVDGGDGFDVIYGGRGDDYLIGGADNDYLDGGRGDDVVSGRGGDDIVSGGNGDDTIFGGTDDDVLITGRGDDAVYDTATGDADSVFAQTGDTLHIDDANAGDVEIFEVYDPDTSRIRTSGTTEERDRIQSDLDTLASIPEGAAVLQSIDENAGGHTVTIGIDATDGSSARPASSDGTYEIGGINGHDPDGTLNPDVGQDGTVSYNPTTTRLYDSRPDEDWHDTPPVVILHHELLHTEDYVHGARDPGESVQVEHDGTGNAITLPGGGPPIEMTLPGGGAINPVNNRELSVVGLPFDEHDESNDDLIASGPGEVDANNRQHTENTLRDQLGLPRRRYY